MTLIETREALLDAAAALMAEGGPAATTTQKVAQKAGVAEGTIYRHFPNKEALIEAVFDRAWARLDAALRAALPPLAEPISRLKAFLGTTTAVMQGHPQEAGLLRQEFAYLVGNARGKCPVPAGSERFIAILEEAIRHAQSEGKARSGLDPAACARFVYNGISKTWASIRPESDPTSLFQGIQTFLDAAFFP